MVCDLPNLQVLKIASKFFSQAGGGRPAPPPPDDKLEDADREGAFELTNHLIRPPKKIWLQVERAPRGKVQSKTPGARPTCSPCIRPKTFKLFPDLRCDPLIRGRLPKQMPAQF